MTYKRSGRSHLVAAVPLWPDEQAHDYVGNEPSGRIDSNGMFASPHPDLCIACAQQIFANYYGKAFYYYNHSFTHCLACCLLTVQAGGDCAQGVQYDQNRGITRKAILSLHYPPFSEERARGNYCKSGITAGEGFPPGGLNQVGASLRYCHDRCLLAYPYTWTGVRRRACSRFNVRFKPGRKGPVPVPGGNLPPLLSACDPASTTCPE